MTPEKKITEAIVRSLRKRKAAGEAIWWLKLHGGPMQRAGVPDLLVVVDGRAVFLEVKQPGKKATRLQLHTLTDLRLAGATAEVVYSTEGANEVFELTGESRR